MDFDDSSLFNDVMKVLDKYLNEMVTNNSGSFIIKHVDYLFGEMLYYSKCGVDILERLENDIRNTVLHNMSDSYGLKKCYALADMLAYVKEYEGEKLVLKTLYDNRINLTQQQKDRLSYLNSGISSMNLVTEKNKNVFAYDYRTCKWSEREIKDYFDSLFKAKKSVSNEYVISEWSQTIKSSSNWDFESASKQIISKIEENFGDFVTCEVVSAKPAGTSDHQIHDALLIKTTGTNRSLNFPEMGLLVFGKQIVKTSITAQIYTVYTPDSKYDSSGNTINKICESIMSIKNMQNPKMNTYITTVQDVVKAELESWFNRQAAGSIY